MSAARTCRTSCWCRPTFADGELFALLASTGHWMDIGGSVPGGWAPRATEIHQEGLIIPPMKLYDRGRLNEQLVKMFTGNVRLPEQIAGDLSAMCNVFNVGRRGLDTLLARYGREKLADCIREMMDRSEAQMRSYIAEIPDGAYKFEDYFDNDGIVDEPVKLCLTLTKSGTDLQLRLHRDRRRDARPDQSRAHHDAVELLRRAEAHLPRGAGERRRLPPDSTSTIPDGSLLSVKYPTPVGGYLEVVGRLLDVMFGALAQAIPQRTPAASFGTTGVTTVAGRHPRTGRYFVVGVSLSGRLRRLQRRRRAGARRDAAEHGELHVDRDVGAPLSRCGFKHFALREDSGGAGQFRGGCGTTYCIRAVDRRSRLGARRPRRSRAVRRRGRQVRRAERGASIRSGNEEFVPPLRSKYEKQPLKAGDLVMNSSPGGGGFGNPLERALEAVELDLNLGYISRATAERDYGAVIAEQTAVGEQTRYRLDIAASEARRNGAVKNSGSAQVSASR